MSLERVKGDIAYICDACEDELETGTDDFEEARAELKRAGWRVAKAGDTWVHRCPDCQPPGWWVDL